MPYDSRACQSFVMTLLKTDGALTDDGALQDHVPQVRRLVQKHKDRISCESQFRLPYPRLCGYCYRGRPRRRILAGNTTSLSPGSSAWRTAPGFSEALTAPR